MRTHFQVCITKDGKTLIKGDNNHVIQTFLTMDASIFNLNDESSEKYVSELQEQLEGKQECVYITHDNFSDIMQLVYSFFKERG